MERLGDSAAFGEVLLDVLERNGWLVHRQAAFAGEGVLVIARRNGLEFKATGPTVAAAAGELFQEATHFIRIPSTQLRLFAA